MAVVVIMMLIKDIMNKCADQLCGCLIKILKLESVDAMY